jgi:hypothetical protein
MILEAEPIKQRFGVLIDATFREFGQSLISLLLFGSRCLQQAQAQRMGPTPYFGIRAAKSDIPTGADAFARRAVVNFEQTHLSNAPKILGDGDGISIMNYVDARIDFQRATEATLEALRRESEQQVREALIQYWLAQKRL